MRTRYKAQWISKSRCEALRKSQPRQDVLLLDTFEGFIVVEPADESLGDGPVLSPDECDYELRLAWYAGPVARLAAARQRLGLGADFPSSP
jgi:hypothetical protein